MSDRVDWQKRTKDVEREFRACDEAIDFYIQQYNKTQLPLPANLKLSDFYNAKSELERTYFVRLFALLEDCLRSYWGFIKPGKQPKMKGLIDGIGAKHGLEHSLILQLHQLREYRNSIIHDSSLNAVTVILIEARRIANQCISRLPDRWG